MKHANHDSMAVLWTHDCAGAEMVQQGMATSCARSGSGKWTSWMAADSARDGSWISAMRDG